MARFWDQLAQELGGQACEETSDNGRIFVLFGELPRCEYTVMGDDRQMLVASISFSEGEHLEALKERISEDPELGALLSKTRLVIGDQNSFFTSEEFHWYLPQDLASPPSPPTCAQLVRALAQALVREAPNRDRFCWGCGETETPLVRARNMTLRHCPACLTLVAECGDKIDALEAGKAAADPGINLGWLGLEHISPRDMLARSEKLEEMYRQSPARYWWTVIGLVLVGQLALAGSASLMVLLGAAGIGLLAWALLSGKAILLILAAKALLLKAGKFLILGLIALVFFAKELLSGGARKPPELPGVQITREDQPELYAWLDSLSDKVEAPKVDLVLLLDQLNAFATERKIKGRWTRVVALGIPLLEAFSQDEMAQVVAHELGHLRHQDTRSLWVYRTAMTWAQLASRDERFSGLMTRFARWYVPHFWLYSEVVMREQEKVADQLSVRVSTPQRVADQLIRIHVLGRLFDEALSQGVNRLARSGVQDCEPVQLLFEELQRMPDERLQEAFQDALEEEPNWLDTHPVLSQRLANLQVAPPARYEHRSLAAEPACRLLRDYPRWRAQAMAELQAHCDIKLKLEERFWRGRLSRAERLKAFEEQQPTPSGQVLLGRIYGSLGRDDEAEACLLRALDLRAGDRAAMQELVGHYIHKMRYREATELLRPHVADDSEDIDLMLVGARCAEKAQEVELAARWYRRLLELDPVQAMRDHLDDRLKKLENPALVDAAADPGTDQAQKPA